MTEENQPEQKKGSSYKELKQVSTATVLEESGHLRLILKGVVVICSLILILILWASFIKIKETAISYGEVIPKGKIQIVQHLEGGIVSKVYVNDGDSVKKGQLLVKLAPASTDADLGQLRGKEISLTLDTERLEAFVKGDTADVFKWSDEVIKSKYNSVARKAEIANLLDDQQRLLEYQNKKLKDSEAALRNTIAQRMEKLNELRNQRKIWESHIKLLRQEFQMYEKLKANNYVSLKDYLTVLRAVNQAEGDGATLLSEIEQTQESILEARNKLAQLKSEAREQALQELSKRNTELLEVRHRIEKIEDKLRRMDVRSPIAGTIKGIKVFAGNVVQPGGTLLDVVPDSTEYLVESKVQPRDIGYIQVGDEVKVKVLTYDYARFGSIAGKITKLSASTFTDEEGRPYYKATTQLDQQYVGKDKNARKLKSGMTVEANIVTGEKTLLQYLLKPIHRTTSEAFKER